jgi:hypothetical protein
VFKFDIVSATGVVHTTEVVKYHLSVPMIATQITFEGVAEGAPKYKYVAFWFCLLFFSNKTNPEYYFCAGSARLSALPSSPLASLISAPSLLTPPRT